MQSLGHGYLLLIWNSDVTGWLVFFFADSAISVWTDHHCSFQTGTTGGGNAAATGAAGETTSASGTERT